MYYVLAPAEDEEGRLMGLTYEPDHRARSFVRGQRLVADETLQVWERPPQEPIRLTIKPDREDAPLPSFLSQPVPLMSKQLFATLSAAGVDNIDVYRAEIYFKD